MFPEKTVTGITYLNMLELYLFAQIDDLPYPVTVSMYKKFSMTEFLAVGLEGVVLFCGHQEALI